MSQVEKFTFLSKDGKTVLKGAARTTVLNARLKVVYRIYVEGVAAGEAFDSMIADTDEADSLSYPFSFPNTHTKANANQRLGISSAEGQSATGTVPAAISPISAAQDTKGNASPSEPEAVKDFPYLTNITKDDRILEIFRSRYQTDGIWLLVTMNERGSDPVLVNIEDFRHQTDYLCGYFLYYPSPDLPDWILRGQKGRTIGDDVQSDDEDDEEKK